jgi:hypothetical protein
MCWEKHDCETSVLARIKSLEEVVAQSEEQHRRAVAVGAVEKFREEFLAELMRHRKARGHA